jgi:alkylated DNA repair dioxygenase AlkB
MQNLPMPDADVRFYPAFFSPEESAAYFEKLRETIAWEQQEFKIFGKAVLMPRLIAWVGDEGKSYSYSGITHQPLAWTKELLEMKARVETAADTSFNSVLINLYRDEKDSMGWHSDDERELGQNPVIASLSFGGVREFQFKHKTKDLRQSIELTNGSLLIMAGETQHHWRHRIPKTKKAIPARMNLTFRLIRD